MLTKKNEREMLGIHLSIFNSNTQAKIYKLKLTFKFSGKARRYTYVIRMVFIIYFYKNIQCINITRDCKSQKQLI